jgi:cytoskeletal protein CcmA (bactofilin family)
MPDHNPDYGTILGADATFKGELHFDSAAKVLGRFEGSITSKGKVHVADGSTCQATITAKDIAVEGLIEGNVEASERLELKPTGRIKGDVVAARMVMADGASIDGHCRIGSIKGDGRVARVTEMKPGAAENRPASTPMQTQQQAAQAGKR